MSGHSNPYREGSKYHKLFGFIQKQQVVTRKGLMAAGATLFDTNILLSPRKQSKRGDLRGNPAAKGHLYFIEPIPKVHKGDDKRFRLKWRDKVLAQLSRENKVKGVKAVKEAVTVTAPVTTEAKPKVAPKVV